MRKLDKIIASALIGASALSVAIPAQAQPYPQGRYDDRYDQRDDRRWDDRRDDRRWDGRDGYNWNGQGIRQQIEELQRRVERNDLRDRISEREAAVLRNSVWRLRQQYRDYARNGLSGREAAVLQQRINDVRQRLRYERRDGDGRRW